MSFKAEKYGQFFLNIYRSKKLNSLGPGQADTNFINVLQKMSINSLFDNADIRDRNAANGCLAALWLHHDFLDESHRISQTITDPSGNFWHGIMHRRERDYWNSKYWFRNVGTHPGFSQLSKSVHDLIAESEETKISQILSAKLWDPFLFVDLCEKYYQTESPEEKLLQKVQQIEWQKLFDHCFTNALLI